MNTDKQYMIDDEPVTSDELIERGKELGYEGNGGIYFTSGSARVLRDHGYTVGNNPDYQKYYDACIECGCIHAEGKCDKKEENV